MKKTARVCSLLLAAVLVLSVSAGCTSSTPKPEEIIMWGAATGASEELVNSFLARYNETAEVKVRYVAQEDMVTKFLTGAISGEVPDIMLWDRFLTPTYAPKNSFAALDAYVEKDGLDMSVFLAEPVKELTYNGSLYGIPMDADGWGLYINLGLMAEKGLQAPETWDDLLHCAEALTLWEGETLVRAGLSMYWLPGLFNSFIQTAGGSILTEDGLKTNFNNDTGKDVLDFWSKLLDARVYKNGFESGMGEGEDGFLTGRVAMAWGALSTMVTYEKYKTEGFEYQYLPMPAGPNGDLGGIMGGFSLVIPEKSANKDEAWELMKWWLFDKENNLEWNKQSRTITTYVEAMDDPFYLNDPNLRNGVEAMKSYKIRPPFPGYSSLETNVVWGQIQSLFEGKITAEQCLQSMTTEGDKLLSQYGQ